MPARTVQCPYCHRAIKAPVSGEARRVKCPHCAVPFVVQLRGGQFHAEVAGSLWWVETPDGKSYGPATADQIRHWYASGRLNADCWVRKSGTIEWLNLGQFLAQEGRSSGSPGRKRWNEGPETPQAGDAATTPAVGEPPQQPTSPPVLAPELLSHALIRSRKWILLLVIALLVLMACGLFVSLMLWRSLARQGVPMAWMAGWLAVVLAALITVPPLLWCALYLQQLKQLSAHPTVMAMQRTLSWQLGWWQLMVVLAVLVSAIVLSGWIFRKRFFEPASARVQVPSAPPSAGPLLCQAHPATNPRG